MIGSPDSDICIISLGASTAIGRSAPATTAAVRAGIAMFGDHPFMVDRYGDPMVLAMASYLPTEMPIGKRICELATAALQESIAAISKIADTIPGPTPLLIGLPSARPGIPDALEVDIQSAIDECGIDTNNLSFLPNGHAAALIAIDEACKLISDGKSQLCIVGGVDSYIDPDTLDWVEQNDQLHQPANAWGFIPGEAAGFCLLCSNDFAEKWNLKSLARVCSVATAQERNRIKTNTVCIGEGLTSAMRQVLEESTGTPPKIQQTICDQNGEAYRADEFGFAIARLNEWFVDSTKFVTPADCWGDVGAASGTLFVALATAYPSFGFQLLWASSEGGDRAAATLAKETA